MHRCLQSCVGTRARLGYAALDGQLWKAYFGTLYVRLCTHMVSSCPVLVISVCMSRNNPGNAQICPGLQAPMHTCGLVNACINIIGLFKINIADWARPRYHQYGAQLSPDPIFFFLSECGVLAQDYESLGIICVFSLVHCHQYSVGNMLLR